MRPAGEAAAAWLHAACSIAEAVAGSPASCASAARTDGTSLHAIPGRTRRTDGCSGRPSRPQFTNSMPSLKVPCVARRNSFSSMPSIALNSRSVGIVASPTPTVPISSDSTSVIRRAGLAEARQRRGAHPSGGSAADDHDLARSVIPPSCGYRLAKRPRAHSSTRSRFVGSVRARLRLALYLRERCARLLVIAVHAGLRR